MDPARSADWMSIQNGINKIPYNTPGTFEGATWQPRQGVSKSAGINLLPPPTGDPNNEYYQRYLRLSQNVAHRYPNPGPPRERQGRIGGTWRHIKEVLGHGGSRVIFVDGLVSLYDHEKALQGSRFMRDRFTAPSYSPLHRQGSSQHKPPLRDAGTPWTDQLPPTSRKGPTLGELPRAPIPPPSPTHRGFYQYQS